jgi:hypothetical protein
MLAEVKRIGEFFLGKRKLIPIKMFEAGCSGGERLRRDMDLDFIPTGPVEVRVKNGEKGKVYEVDETRLRRPKK